MIKVRVKPETITVSGHAFYDNGILSLDKKAIKYSVKKGLVKINIISKDETTKKLLENMIDLFKSLEKDYPKNIKEERE